MEIPASLMGELVKASKIKGMTVEQFIESGEIDNWGLYPRWKDTRTR